MQNWEADIVQDPILVQRGDVLDEYFDFDLYYREIVVDAAEEIDADINHNNAINDPNNDEWDINDFMGVDSSWYCFDIVDGEFPIKSYDLLIFVNYKKFFVNIKYYYFGRDHGHMWS